MAARMKDSGIEGIGLIPENWDETRRVKDIFTLSKGLPITKDNLLDEGLPVISYGQVHSKDNTGTFIKDLLIRYVDYGYRKDRTSQVKKGDFIFADTSEDLEGCGNCVYVDREDEIFAGYHTITFCSDNTDNRYLAYLFTTDAWRTQIRKRVYAVKVYTVSQKILKECKVILPPQREQRAIADFLDKRCAQIAGVIADLEKQIELLCQYKTSILRELTSRGIDNGMFKSTGIEWLSEIPEHWSMSKMRYIADICSGATPSKDNLGYWEGDIPWISSMEVKTDILYDTSLHISEEAVSSCSTQIMPIGTMVMVVRSGILQHTLPVALLGVPATINQDIKAFTFNVGVSSAYVKYFIQGNNDALLDTLLKDKSTVESIEYSRLLGCPIPIPPLNEQEEIVKVLDKKCSLIDSIVSDKRRQLEDAVQNRKSLIYEYVTGKKRVKEVDGYAD